MILLNRYSIISINATGWNIIKIIQHAVDAHNIETWRKFTEVFFKPSILTEILLELKAWKILYDDLFNFVSHESQVSYEEFDRD